MNSFLNIKFLSKISVISLGLVLVTSVKTQAATWTYTNNPNGLINVTTNLSASVSLIPQLQSLPGTNIFIGQSFSPGYSPNTQETTSLPPDTLVGTPSNPVYLKQFRIGNFNNADRQLFIFEQLQANVALNLATPNQLLSLSVGAIIDLDGDSTDDIQLIGIGGAASEAGVYSFGNGLALNSGINSSYFALATADPNATLDVQTQIEVSELAVTVDSLNTTLPVVSGILDTVLPVTITSGGYAGGVGYLSPNLLNTYNPTVGVNPNLTVNVPLLGNVAVGGNVDAGFDWLFEAQFSNEPTEVAESIPEKIMTTPMLLLSGFWGLSQLLKAKKS